MKINIPRNFKPLKNLNCDQIDKKIAFVDIKTNTFGLDWVWKLLN